MIFYSINTLGNLWSDRLDMIFYQNRIAVVGKVREGKSESAQNVSIRGLITGKYVATTSVLQSSIKLIQD